MRCEPREQGEIDHVADICFSYNLHRFIDFTEHRACLGYTPSFECYPEKWFFIKFHTELSRGIPVIMCISVKVHMCISVSVYQCASVFVL